jgi:hypothetical protein
MKLVQNSLCMVGLALLLSACIFQTANSFSGDVKIKTSGTYALVAPIWSNRGCTSCHPSLATLSTDEEWLASGEWGGRIVPGDSDNSKLFNACNWGAQGTQIMPPSGASNSSSLTADELQLLAEWINSVSPSSN